MAYTLEQLSADIGNALKKRIPGMAGKQAVCGLVSKVLMDKDFVEKHLTADQCRPRKVLYEDPELGFCICGFMSMRSAAHGGPHDRPRLELGDLRPGDRRHGDDGLAHRQEGRRRRTPGDAWSSRRKST